MFISDQACLLRKTNYGENSTLFVFFLRETGLKNALARQSSKPSATSQLPDLFEYGEVIIEQKEDSKPAFLKDFTSTERFPGIARNYQGLMAASQLSRFFERNLIHMEHFPKAWELLLKALSAFSDKNYPEAVLFKALYLFARLEGYPVRQQWLEQQSPAFRARVIHVLRNPVETCPEKKEALRDWTGELFKYFQRETDLFPPDL